jgi:RHS repeat-associated protein
MDRTASVGDGSRYFPYGEDRSTAPDDAHKFATYYRDAGSGLDYAVNRYYSSTYGRFTSADPYRASGGPADPGSWNRYAYVQGDPVNLNDPSGEYAVIIAGGGSGPAAPLVFVAWAFWQIFRGPTLRRDPGWQTDAEVNARVAQRERDFWVRKKEVSDEDMTQYPMFLRLTDDCYKTQALGGGSPVRRRRYQVLDQWGVVIANPGTVQVKEHHDVRFSSTGFSADGVWGQGSKSLLTRDAQFDDIVAAGASEFWTYQSFTASSPGNANRPLMILDGSNMWTTLGIHASGTRININGNDGPYLNGKRKECDTPDLIPY